MCFQYAFLRLSLAYFSLVWRCNFCRIGGHPLLSSLYGSLTWLSHSLVFGSCFGILRHISKLARDEIFWNPLLPTFISLFCTVWHFLNFLMILGNAVITLYIRLLLCRHQQIFLPLKSKGIYFVFGMIIS